MGESGCGKSSFLQAGLLPRMNQAESHCHGIYVKFSDRAPIETVKDALMADLLATDPALDRANPEFADLLKLMQVAPQILKKPVVLFFDQFEQVFVHQRRPGDRQPFIDILTVWYQAESPMPLKILVTIRADLVHELYELHQAMGYTLSRYDVFKLEKFEPEEATEILRVIAETEGWLFDRSFVKQLSQDDLASSQGKVSPVDLQILAETVRKQPATRRAFTEATFRQMGGLEGLLNRYLEETLEVLKLNNLYQPAILVLLALIDRERNLRAGVLTLAELEAKLQGTVRPKEVQQAMDWLASGEVRLITPIEQQNKSGYELAHERIIPAIVRVAGQELKAAERANCLLDRRVNEWIGNGRSHDYLLSWRELWLLRQQKDHLVWGANRRDKEKLLKQSWQTVYRAIWALLMALILLLTGFAVWSTPWGQRSQMHWELAGLRQKISDGSRKQASVAFAEIGNQQQAFSMIDLMNSPSYKADALSAIAGVYGKLNETEVAKSGLAQLQTIAEKIDDSFSKAHTLSAIAEAYSKLSQPEAAKSVLVQAQNNAEKIDEPSSKAFALSSIAEAYSKLSQPEAAKSVLVQAQIIAEKIDEPSSKAFALTRIAEAYIKLNQPEVAKSGLAQLQTTAEKIDDSFSKTRVLSAIARAYIKLGQPETAQTIAENIDELGSKASVLIAIAEAYSKLNEPEAVKSVLVQAQTTAETIDQPSSKADALSSIAEAYSKLSQPEAAKSMLLQAQTTAEKIDDPFSKAFALSSIAKAYAELEDWRQVNLTAALCTSNDCKAGVLSSGLTVWAEHQHPELKEEEEEGSSF
jgi:tetratricopeptide (TPR) repeat protein